jgi:membrane carboxypeptidase/penicillin-binding protein
VVDFVTEWGDRNGYNLYTDGLKIYTTIDSRMQQYANRRAGADEEAAENLCNITGGPQIPGPTRNG